MAEPGKHRPQGIAGTWPTRDASQAGGLAPAGVPLRAAFVERLSVWARAEAGAGRLLPWLPVAFGTGIALYFAADREPVLTVAAATASGLCVLAFALRW